MVSLTKQEIYQRQADDTELQAPVEAAEVTGGTEVDSVSSSWKITTQKLDMMLTGLHFSKTGNNFQLKCTRAGGMS